MFLVLSMRWADRLSGVRVDLGSDDSRNGWGAATRAKATLEATAANINTLECLDRQQQRQSYYVVTSYDKDVVKTPVRWPIPLRIGSKGDAVPLGAGKIRRSVGPVFVERIS